MPYRNSVFSWKGGGSGGARLLVLLLVPVFSLGPASCTSKKRGNAPVREDLFEKADRTSEKLTGELTRKKSVAREKSSEELEQIEESNRDQAIEKYRSILAKKDKLDPATRESCLINLGHVTFEKCLADYRKRMRDYDQAYAAYQRGTTREEPSLPRYDFSSARKVYQEYLASFPGSPLRPEVTYNLAFSYEEEGALDQAVSLYDELTLTAPKSRFSPEAYLRLGEHFFELDQFDKAIDYYRKVQDLGDSQFYDKALFKTGWALYAKGDFPGAEEAFAQLLERQSALKGEKKRDLYNESLEILAKIQSETGGAKALDSFLSRHKSPAYGLDLSLQLGNYFQETARYEDAIDTYKELLERYPGCDRAPFVEHSLIESLKTERRTPEAEQLEGSLLDRYGRGTPWDRQNPDPELRKEVDTLLWTTMNNEILAHHRTAREQKDPGEYDKTIALYKKSIAYFPMDENAYETRFLYAECLYESGRPEEAAKEYEQVAKLEPFDTYREKALSNRIQCLEDLRARDQVNTDTLLSAYADYIRMNPRSEKTPQLLFKQGEILFNASRYGESAAFFRQIVQEYPNHPDTPRAWMLELECLFQGNRYPELEQFAHDLLAGSVPLTAEQRQRADHLLRFAQFEQAHEAQKAGQYAAAAESYEKLVREAPDIDIAPDALFNAAVCYRELNNWDKASSCFERITVRYPQSKHYNDALLAPLSYYEETGQWDRVLPVLDKLYKLDPRNELARESLFKLAKRFRKKGEADQARTAFSQYAERYPDDISRNLEILYMEAEIQEDRGDPEAALRGYQRFLDAYEKREKAAAKIELDPTFIAKAQFMVLEPDFANYEAIRLVPPLERNLARKQSLLDRLVSEYLKAAKSGAGPFALASACRLGLAYENFWSCLIHSDLPEGMTDEEADLYRNLLETQAEPYKKKAIDAYRVTLEKTEGKGILNPWILRAYGHLSGLDPATYPPLLRDTVVWKETWKEKRLLVWNLDLSRPRDFKPEKAAKLQKELETILKDLHQESTEEGEKDRAGIENTIALLERLLKKEPGLYEIHFNLGILYQMLGQSTRAMGEYLAALKGNPDLPIAHLNLGILYLQDGDLPRAENEFTEMTRLSPEYAGSWYLLGVTQIRGGSYPKAEKSLKQAVSLLPQFLDPVVELGMVYQKTGREDEALKQFRIVLYHPKTSARLLKKLAWNFLETGYVEEAIECYNRVAEMKKATYEDWNNLGVAYLRSDKLQPALVALNQARKRGPNQPEAINNLGLVYLKKKEYDQAAEAFEQASALATNYLTPLMNSAVLYGEYLENEEKAAACIEKYLAQGGTVQREMLKGWITKPKEPGPGQ
jgi:cellulose synthase operon protein C